MEALTQSLSPKFSDFDRTGLLKDILAQFRIKQHGAHGPSTLTRHMHGAFASP